MKYIYAKINIFKYKIFLMINRNQEESESSLFLDK